MVDDRLGRHSVLVASLGLIPGAVVVIVLAVGIATPAVSYSHVLLLVVFSIPSVAAFVLARLNGRNLVRAIVLSVGALLMVGVWYALLILPAAAVCSVARGNACM
ncbi:MAG: hypothetical protein ACJ76X_02000 [Solirubrobacteraceae bacterium]